MTAFRQQYGIPSTTVVKIVSPPEEIAAMGHKPFIVLPLFGDYANVTAFRAWCDANFAHPHKVGDHPLYDSYRRNIGFDVTVYGDEEDLMLLQFAC